MFENITKGVWSIDQQKVKVNKHGTTVFPLRIDTEPICFTNVARIYEPEANRQNAEFIAYCFNIQQRFDISKLEEAVEVINKLRSELFTVHSKYGDKKNAFDHSVALRESEQLLTQIKK